MTFGPISQTGIDPVKRDETPVSFMAYRFGIDSISHSQHLRACDVAEQLDARSLVKAYEYRRVLIT